MTRSPGTDNDDDEDEPTRPGAPPRSTHAQRRAQSSNAAASTSSLPGRDSSSPSPTPRPLASAHPHPSAETDATPTNGPSSPDIAKNASASASAGATEGINNNGSASGLSIPTTAHAAGAAREEDTTGTAVSEPGGGGGWSEVVDRNDDTALSTANDREATELASIARRSPPSTQAASVVAAAEVGAGDELSEAPTQRDECCERERQKYRLTRQRVGWTDVLARWWRRHVSVTVPAGGMRDHLALERTFLGYLRTSIALSMTGVIIAQLMRLQHAPNPDPVFGYHALGKPLAAVFIVAAMLMALLGAFRFWRQQNAMVRGKVYAGGWEILAVMIGSLMLTITVFVLTVAVEIKKTIEGVV